MLSTQGYLGVCCAQGQKSQSSGPRGPVAKCLGKGGGEDIIHEDSEGRFSWLHPLESFELGQKMHESHYT